MRQAEVLGDEDGLLVITRTPEGSSVAGFGPRAAGLAEEVAARGDLEPLLSLDLPRSARLTQSACTQLGLAPQPGWDWLVIDHRPPAPTVRIDRLDLHTDKPAIQACLAESNPDTDAVPGADDDAGWWGATADGVLLGVIGASQRDGDLPGGFSWHLHGLGVRPAARRRGLGAALTTAATRAGFEAGLDWVSLGVWADNAGAIAIYHRLGFQTKHQRGSYRPALAQPFHVC